MKIKVSIDDCSTDDIRIAQLLVKYDLVNNTIFYWPVMPHLCNEPRGRISLTEQQMQDIAGSFVLGSHGLTHALLTRIPLETAKREIFESRELLQKKFNQPIDSFSYPRGYANPDLMKLVQEAGYTSARSTIVGYIHESENPYFEQTTVHAGPQRKEYAGKHWLEYARYMLDQARDTKDSVVSIWCHSWELTKFGSWQDFELLLKELKEAI